MVRRNISIEDIIHASLTRRYLRVMLPITVCGSTLHFVTKNETCEEEAEAEGAAKFERDHTLLGEYAGRYKGSLRGV